MREALPDDHNVLRRFNPDNRDHYVFDEKTQKVRFRSGALRFDEYPDFRGCSVYCDEVLQAEGLPRSEILQPPYVSLVIAEVIVINALQSDVTDVQVLSDPWPEGKEAAPEADVAHALITAPTDVPRRAWDKLTTRLARDVFREVAL